MTQENIPKESSNPDRKKRLAVVRVKLHSQRPSDIFGAILEVRNLLQENIEDQEVYETLLDAVRDNPGLRQEVRDLLEETIQKGSKYAAGALRVLPADTKDLMADADDAYYTADYDQAIELYQQVLEKDPVNVLAKEQLAKAELNRIAGMPDTELPRAAIQHFRRARSHIAARDFVSATNLLNAALEEARVRGKDFPEAEKLINSIQDLWTADEYKTKADSALKNELWGSAWDLYNKALLLNPHDQVIKKLLEGLDGLMRADAVLDSLANQPNNEKERREKLEKIDVFLKKAEEIKTLVGTSLLKNSRTRYNQYQGMRPKTPIFALPKQFAGVIILLLVIVIAVLSLVWKEWNSDSEPPLGSTPNSTLSVTVGPTPTSSLPSPTVSPNPTVSFTPTVTPTETLTPTPTLTILGLGSIVKKSVSVLDAPNGKLVVLLVLKEPLQLTILQQVEVSNDIWYQCTFEYDGKEYKEVWIFAKSVVKGPISSP